MFRKWKKQTEDWACLGNERNKLKTKFSLNDFHRFLEIDFKRNHV